MKIKKIATILSLFVCSNTIADENLNLALGYDSVADFIYEYSSKNKYTKEELVEYFARTKIKKMIVKQSNNQPEVKLTWGVYQKKVVTQNKIEKGLQFIKNNKVLLESAEKQYGVPSEIITSILGIETFYGKYKGNHKAIDAISTMAFEGSKRRQSYFIQELNSFFDYCYDNKLNPLEQKSSWAGAFGYPQFMPSSILNYGIDFDSDGRIDLVNSLPDAIGSIANYLNKNGWRRDNYIAEEVYNVDESQFDKFGSFNLEYTVKELKNNGVKFDRSMRDSKRLKIFDVEKDNKKHYMVGYDNFKSLTLYNRSNLYALAVFDLANKIKQSEVK